MSLKTRQTMASNNPRFQATAQEHRHGLRAIMQANLSDLDLCL